MAARKISVAEKCQFPSLWARRKFSNNTSSAWERMDNNVGKVANATKDGSSVQNDFDYCFKIRYISN